MTNQNKGVLGVGLVIVAGGLISYGANWAWGAGVALIAAGIYVALIAWILLGNLE